MSPGSLVMEGLQKILLAPIFSLLAFLVRSFQSDFSIKSLLSMTAT